MDRQIELGTPGLAGLCGFHRVGIGFVERVLLYNAPLIFGCNKKCVEFFSKYIPTNP
jgi:hypothetical protein